MVWIKVLVIRRKSVGVLAPSAGGARIDKLDYGQLQCCNKAGMSLKIHFVDSSTQMCK